MTKNEEIEILRDAVAKLGNDSYCGEWLASVIDEVESLIRSDIMPTAKDISVRASSEAACLIRRDAEEFAKGLRGTMDSYARQQKAHIDDLVRKAGQLDDARRNNFREEMRRLLNTI